MIGETTWATLNRDKVDNKVVRAVKVANRVAKVASRVVSAAKANRAASRVASRAASRAAVLDNNRARWIRQSAGKANLELIRIS